MTHRRTVRLRCEEVAQRANVNATWYTPGTLGSSRGAAALLRPKESIDSLLSTVMSAIAARHPRCYPESDIFCVRSGWQPRGGQTR